MLKIDIVVSPRSFKKGGRAGGKLTGRSDAQDVKKESSGSLKHRKRGKRSQEEVLEEENML